jgi:hypothetical protein
VKNVSCDLFGDTSWEAGVPNIAAKKLNYAILYRVKIK